MVAKSNTPAVLGIREAARLVGRQEHYVRILVTGGKIAGTKTAIPGTDVPRWEVDTQSLLEYFGDGKNRRTARDDNRNKWSMYATKAELTQVKDLLHANGLGAVANLIAPAFDSEKAKEYRTKRAAKKAAEKPKTEHEKLVAEIAAAHPIEPPTPTSTPSKESRKAFHAKDPLLAK